MNWKEFLKPNGRKIIVFVILILICFFSLSFLVLVDLFGMGGVSPYLMAWVIVNWPLVLGSLVTGKVIVGLLPIFIIMDIFWFYSLSCIIIWLYDKIKKVKK